MERRNFITKLGYASALWALAPAITSCFQSHREKFKGEIVGANSAIGHKLRDQQFAQPSVTKHVRTLILGAGVAGLSAARTLKKNGDEDFVVIELADQPGGNSASGKNEVSEYPWGAHYLPVINPNNHDLYDFLREHEIIIGENERGILYNPLYLCADPEERLHIQGYWQSGLIPTLGLSEQEKQEIAAFFSTMEKMRNAIGTDGKNAFDIPVANSSDDPAFIQFDQIDMKTWLQQMGWNTSYLHWYVNYCCKDDYGTKYDETSAWAGIHYFASRKGRVVDGGHEDVLTWPEGNQFLVQKLLHGNHAKLQLKELAFEIKCEDEQVIVKTWQAEKDQVIQYTADAVICCLPRYIIQKLNPELITSTGYLPGYAPWMVANITLVGQPQTIAGAPLSWDNVLYNSNSLGYVNACHQKIRVYNNKTVLTYYYPVSDLSPTEARQMMHSKTHEEWCHDILQDLQYAHPDIAKQIEDIQVWMWGHGMVRPVPGFYTDDQRRQAATPHQKKIFFAHSDLSGISIFEEAFSHGHRAAQEVLQYYFQRKTT